MDQTTDPPRSESEDSIIQAVEFNGQLLEQLLDELAELRTQLSERPTVVGTQDTAAADELEQLRHQVAEFQQQVAESEQRITDLQEQNEDLASRVASSNVRQRVACAQSGSGDALNWEERKKLILQQMEEGSYDAEAFISELGSEDSDSTEPLDPLSYVRRLHEEAAQTQQELERRDQEIHELRSLLEEQSVTCDGGVAIGAAAIAEMIDADELVQQERERLQLLQEEWEEKFRQGEIEASLERAKLSRERLELARKNSELEEQLEHVRREARNVEETGPPSRRWLTKLGLTD